MCLFLCQTNIPPRQDSPLCPHLTHPQALYLDYDALATVASLPFLNTESPTSQGLAALDLQS